MDKIFSFFDVCWYNYVFAFCKMFSAIEGIVLFLGGMIDIILFIVLPFDLMLFFIRYVMYLLKKSNNCPKIFSYWRNFIDKTMEYDKTDEKSVSKFVIFFVIFSMGYAAAILISKQLGRYIPN